MKISIPRGFKGLAAKCHLLGHKAQNLSAPEKDAAGVKVQAGEGCQEHFKQAVPLAERAAYTPAEFAALFGKHYTWGYRQIYAGKVKVISDMGRMLVSRSEVERIKGKGVVYSGKK
jgi:hypothetical protein